MALHELPEAELAEHFRSDACPCSPVLVTGERPDHPPGLLVLHHAFRPERDDEGPVSRAPLVEPAA